MCGGGREEALVAVAEEEVRIKLAQVQIHVRIQHPDRVRAVDAAEHAFVLARPRQPLEWHAHPRLRRDRVEDGDSRAFPLRLHRADRLRQLVHQIRVVDRVGDLDPSRLRRRRLAHVHDRLLARRVYGREVHDDVSPAEHQVPEDRVHRRRGIGHEDDVPREHAQQRRNLPARVVEQRGVLVAEVGVGRCLHAVLEAAQGVADGADDGAEGAFECRYRRPGRRGSSYHGSGSPSWDRRGSPGARRGRMATWSLPCCLGVHESKPRVHRFIIYICNESLLLHDGCSARCKRLVVGLSNREARITPLIAGPERRIRLS